MIDDVFAQVGPIGDGRWTLELVPMDRGGRVQREKALQLLQGAFGAQFSTGVNHACANMFGMVCQLHMKQATHVCTIGHRL
jgi:hypothetical protein